MRWPGETPAARFLRAFRDWQTAFALLPMQMSDGSWVWLERYEWKMYRTPIGEDYHRRALGSAWEPPGPPTGPPPPRRT